MHEAKTERAKLWKENVAVIEINREYGDIVFEPSLPSSRTYEIYYHVPYYRYSNGVEIIR